jgi:hypothetical protein
MEFFLRFGIISFIFFPAKNFIYLFLPDKGLELLQWGQNLQMCFSRHSLEIQTKKSVEKDFI